MNSMSCPFCMSKLLKPGLEVYATQCGHVYHEMCLRGWVAKNKSCPTCRKPVHESQMTHLFLNNDEAGNKLTQKDDLMLASFKSVVEDVTASNMMTMVATIKESIGNPMKKLQEAEQQILSLRQEINDLEQEAGTTGKTRAQTKAAVTNKAKDKIIEGLQKEIEDLKARRAEEIEAAAALRDEIAKLKATVKGESQRPLRENNGPVKQTKQTLVLKFDDNSDKLIVE